MNHQKKHSLFFRGFAIFVRIVEEMEFWKRNIFVPVLILAFFALGGEAFGQALVLEGSIESQNDKSDLSGAKVIVKKNGSKIDQATADAKGKFEVSLPPNGVYLVEFTYPGYVTKRISFNTKNIPPDVAAEGDFPFPMSMTLFQEVEGLDVSILDKPMAEVLYDPKAVTFTFDKNYTKSMKAQIEKLQEDWEKKMEEEAARLAEAEAGYKESMSSGTKSMGHGDFGVAAGHFQKALSFKPDDPEATKKLEEARKKKEKADADRQQEKAYEEAIENAELALHDEDFKEAETQFQAALDAKPGDIYARDQLKEIRNLMVAAAKAEQTYITAIGKADAALAVQDYITAKAEYQRAADAKPEEAYPKDQLKEVESLLVADAQKESDYIKAIERGESSMESNDFEAAKAAFEQASEIKPEEKFPKDQLAKIEGILAEIALKNKNYDAAIAKADGALKDNEFEVAKAAYTEALDIKPDQQYPKDQIAAINAKLEEIKQLESQYEELIADADKRFETQDYVAAKSEYTKALEIKPNAEHPKARVAEISAILEKEAKIEEEYKAAISNADNAFKANDFSSAKFEYEAASKLKPDEEYPKSQLALVETKLGELAKLDEDYNAAIKEGDEKLAANDFEGAKASFTAALALKSEEQYPKDQLAVIDQKMIELENLNKQYDELIAKADGAFEGGEYEQAKSDFQKALDLKPTETYPQEKIAAITTLLAEKEAAEAEYQALIQKADAAMEAKTYEEAQTSYTAALELKPDASHPKEKLSEIDAILANLAELQKQYDDAIAAADEKFNNNELEAALPLYEKAAGIKEGESYPVDQISKIEASLASMKEKDEAYAAAIGEAEAAEKGSDLTAALAGYKKAREIKPDEAYPQEKIPEITALIAEAEKKDAAYTEAIVLADEAAKNEEYDIAITSYTKASEIKPEEEYPKQKLEEVKELQAAALAAIELANKQEEEYKAFIEEGDKLLATQDYEKAKSQYQSALGVKPTETYPQDKINEIDGLMADQLAAKEKDEKYAAAIAGADQAFQNKDWENAKQGYNEAKSIKPEESYPSDQLLAIETAMAEELALASEKAKEEKYNAAIAAGDDAFNSEEWETAKASYDEAKSIKPAETYPDEQLKAIDAAIAAAAALAAKEAADLAAKEKYEKYNTAIATADAAFKSEDWETAKDSYNEAKGVKPEETYPDEQLKAIDEAIAAAAALAAQEAADLAAKEKEEKYAAAISAGDAAFKSEDWESAKASYNEAKGVKPEETYPDEQLKAIDEAIAAAAALAAKEAAESAAKEKEEKYNAAIASGDAAFKAKDWETAKTSYNEAKSVKPEETYPSEQLLAIEEAIAAAAALAAKEAAEMAAQQKEENYKAAVKAGDDAFKQKDWNAARGSYKEALSIKPKEEYPSKRLAAIDEAEKEMNAKQRKSDYDAYISTADKAFKSKDWTSAKTNYESASSLFPEEQYPKDQLVRVEEELAKAEAIALQSQTDEKYRQLIGDADQLFNSEDYNSAKAKYQEAISVKPEEVYPKNRIAKIDQIMSDEQAALAAIDEQYNRYISQADADFNAKKYPAAKAYYEKALNVKSDPYPTQRIEEIDGILVKRNAALMAAKEQKAAKRAEYDALISAADGDFRAENYESARDNYKAALVVMPGEKYPAGKIEEIEQILNKPVASAPVPAKQSSGLSDAEISAMMLKWQQERDQAKADQLDQYKKDLRETSEERVNSADDRIAESNQGLDELETQIAESNKAGADRNLQEAAVVDEIRKEQKDFYSSKSDETEEKRNDKYSDLEENEEGQREMKEEGNQLYQVNTEKKTTEKIELQNQQRERSESAHDGLLVEYEGIQEIEEDVREQKAAGADHYMDEVERVQKDNTLVVATVRTWQDEDREMRHDAHEQIVKQEREIREFKQDNSESYMYNTEKYWEDTDQWADYKERKRKEQKQQRDKAYGEIEDYNEDVAAITLEKNNKYDENNERIREENQDYLNQTAQLTADADERRMEFDRNFYTGEELPRLPEKAAQYSQGVTEESFQENDAYVIKRIVVTGENIDEYEKIFYKWGGVYYKKNGRPITETIWNTETQ